MSRIETIGDATLYLGDCREILPTLGKVDAVVTDPPYGISYDPSLHKRYDGSENVYSRIEGDDTPCDMSFIYALDCPKIVWGAENNCRQIPHRGRWICWNKRSPATRPNSMPSSDFELAWIDRESGFYKYVNVIHGGVVNADSTNNGNNSPRLHPTQKPVSVMKFCIEQFSTARVILDPFMGSGTTGVAAIRLGRQFIGIEIEPRYFDIACRRIDEASRQKDLFIETKDDALAATVPELLL